MLQHEVIEMGDELYEKNAETPTWLCTDME